MTTILFFQNLAWVCTEPPIRWWPRSAWRFANQFTLPIHISNAAWNRGYNSFYGYDR